MDMATPVKNSRLSTAMERTGQWIFSQEIPTDVEVVVGAANFPLHKFMLVAKSNYIRKLIMDTKEPDLASIDLSDIPGGAATFEKAAKFCYGVNFEITVQNVAALRCAAEFLEMTDQYCDNNLAGRTEDFLNQVALTSLSGSIVVLKSCQNLLPLAQDLNLVRRCVDVAASKASVEANFPSRSPPNWWTEELSILNIDFFGKVLTSMKLRGSKALTIASALITYTERNLGDLVRGDPSSGFGIVKASSAPDDSTTILQRDLLESIVALLPQDKAAFPINFLCGLLRSAIYLKASTGYKGELEKRISAILEHVTVDDLLLLSFSYDGESLFDLDSVRKIIAGFVDREKSMVVFNGGAGDFKEATSTATQRVGKTVDVYLGEIATYDQLSISKFNGIANLIPKGARKVDDDLYRAIDIYLKAHPHLDEIEREKVCSGMDPLKLSYEARVHASQNKRLPVQTVLHALYYDQLKLRSGLDGNDRKSGAQDAIATRDQLQADVSLMKENEALRTELLKMKMYISDMQQTTKPNQGASSSSSSLALIPTKVPSRKPTFLSSMSKTLGKLNPFRQVSKDTSNIDDGINVTKPRRRRFSMS